MSDAMDPCLAKYLHALVRVLTMMTMDMCIRADILNIDIMRMEIHTSVRCLGLYTVFLVNAAVYNNKTR